MPNDQQPDRQPDDQHRPDGDGLDAVPAAAGQPTTEIAVAPLVADEGTGVAVDPADPPGDLTVGGTSPAPGEADPLHELPRVAEVLKTAQHAAAHAALCSALAGPLPHLPVDKATVAVQALIDVGVLDRGADWKVGYRLVDPVDMRDLAAMLGAPEVTIEAMRARVDRTEAWCRAVVDAVDPTLRERLSTPWTDADMQAVVQAIKAQRVALRDAYRSYGRASGEIGALRERLRRVRGHLRDVSATADRLRGQMRAAGMDGDRFRVVPVALDGTPTPAWVPGQPSTDGARGATEGTAPFAAQPPPPPSAPASTSTLWFGPTGDDHLPLFDEIAARHIEKYAPPAPPQPQPVEPPAWAASWTPVMAGMTDIRHGDVLVAAAPADPRRVPGGWTLTPDGKKMFRRWQALDPTPAFDVEVYRAPSPRQVADAPGVYRLGSPPPPVAAAPPPGPSPSPGPRPRHELRSES